METGTEKALQELREFLEAEDIYDGDSLVDGVTAFIVAYTKQGDDLATSLDDLDRQEEAIEKTETEMAGLIGQTDAARSLWNLILNLHREFDMPPSMGPGIMGVDLEGCERVVQSLAKIVRGAMKAGRT